ncbi:Regulatory protein cys-3 [Pseudocercospora fuligena]|uniref:Regulatory protein cys-3 n=1 Tax=Pseudocercospora fuligena TaxID=685502 RepID=A0A8H6VII9_9PEZI|nr:Regulatory protein cys-3 [Pseudocercospora fuligena]
MSNYNGRRAPNVSQYVAGLNQPAPEMPQFDDFETNFDSLANLEFFDLDAAAGFPNPGPTFPQDAHIDAKNGQQQFNGFNEFQAFTGTAHTSPASALPSPPPLQGNYPPQPQYQHNSPVTGDKRKASAAALPTAADLEEASRMAAEEDKRRRNTAASARFRIKKKQREQALEKQTKEMTDKVNALESKVQQLEMENKWLKELITEKSDMKILEAKLEQRHSENKDASSRSTESHTDGVGTKDAKAEEA